MTEPFRVLVLSDLHAVEDADSAAAYPAMNYAQPAAPRALLNFCLSAIQEEFPTGVDLVVVAGDMTNRASGGNLASVWEDLHWLASKLDAPLVATAGNHDYDSRATEGPLPYSALMGLQPTFPFGDANTRNKYFAQGHAIFRNDRVIVLSANSPAHHGYEYEGKKELDHGRYSEALPGWMETSLAEEYPLPPVKLFLTHHHVNQLPGFDLQEWSAAVNSEEVLRVLQNHGDWLVIHGHKHRGWIQYASGSGDAPPLLSASSFSANFGNGSFATKVRHQFHVVEIPYGDRPPADGLTGARGRVHSWTHSRMGWEPAGDGEDLPGVSGFGWKTHLGLLAERIASQVAQDASLNRLELQGFEPRMQFLTFDDQRRLISMLLAKTPQVRTILDLRGQIEEFSISTEMTP